MTVLADCPSTIRSINTLAANTSLSGGGRVDGAIHPKAGSQLQEACRVLGGCKVGEAKITGGYNLPAKYFIHTIGPIWKDGQYNESELLANCYENSLALAEKIIYSPSLSLASVPVFIIIQISWQQKLVFRGY